MIFYDNHCKKTFFFSSNIHRSAHACFSRESECRNNRGYVTINCHAENDQYGNKITTGKSARIYLSSLRWA